VTYYRRQLASSVILTRANAPEGKPCCRLGRAAKVKGLIRFRNWMIGSMGGCTPNQIAGS
jgi:hypothetical protein